MLVPEHDMLLLADADNPFFKLVSSSFCSLEQKKREAIQLTNIMSKSLSTVLKNAKTQE